VKGAIVAVALAALAFYGFSVGGPGDTGAPTAGATTTPTATPTDPVTPATPEPTASMTPTPLPTATPPLEPEPLRFAVVGDFGTGDARQYAVARRMCRWRTNHPYDLVITTGDNIYPDGRPANFRPNFFRPYRCLFKAGVRFRASLGNHDVMTANGQYQLDHPRFGMKRRNYVVRKEGVRFVIANSTALNWEWLRHALKPDQGDRWTIVVFHHPVFSAGTGHGSTPGFDRLPDLFARKGVDLVLNGHDHVYAVTREVRQIRYVVTGGGGAPFYGCGSEPHTVMCVPRLHFLYVVAGPDDIHVRAVPAKGGVFDRFRTDGRP